MFIIEMLKMPQRRTATAACSDIWWSLCEVALDLINQDGAIKFFVQQKCISRGYCGPEEHFG